MVIDDKENFGVFPVSAEPEIRIVRPASSAHSRESGNPGQHAPTGVLGPGPPLSRG